MLSIRYIKTKSKFQFQFKFFFFLLLIQCTRFIFFWFLNCWSCFLELGIYHVSVLSVVWNPCRCLYDWCLGLFKRSAAPVRVSKCIQIIWIWKYFSYWYYIIIFVYCMWALFVLHSNICTNVFKEPTAVFHSPDYKCNQIHSEKKMWKNYWIFNIYLDVVLNSRSVMTSISFKIQNNLAITSHGRNEKTF